MCNSYEISLLKSTISIEISAVIIFYMSSSMISCLQYIGVPSVHILICLS